MDYCSISRLQVQVGLLGLMVDTGQKYREIDNTVSSTAPVSILSLALTFSLVVLEFSQCSAAVQSV